MPLILSLSKINLVGQPSPTGATLDIPFANQKNIIDIISGSSLITFTRASTATFVGSNGLIQTAAANTPRFDHNPTTGESLGMLVEEARTNLLLRSEEFDNVTWVKFASTVTSNVSVSPDGATTADKLVETTAASSLHYVTQVIANIGTSTISVYAKKSERSVLRIQTGGDNYGADFDLNNGTVGNIVSATASIVAYQNGWYKCSISTTNTLAFNGVLFLLNSGGFNTAVYTGDGSSGLFLWGAQVESGLYGTSYIQTTATSATRNACNVKINTLSPWFNTSVGTLFAQGIRYSPSAPVGVMAGFAQNLNSANAIYITSADGGGGSSIINGIVIDSTVAQSVLADTITPNGSIKVASAYEQNNFGMSVNGRTVQVDNSGTIPSSIQNLSIGSSPWSAAGDNNWSGWIRRVAYYPRRLSNTELQLITN